MTAVPKTTKAVPAKTSSAKKKTPRAKVGPTAARVAIMRDKALAMLNAGALCPEIGAALGISRERAWQLAKEAMAMLKAETLDKAGDWRVTITHRQIARLQILDEIANVNRKDDPALTVSAIGKAKEIDVELGKLWGAYAPTTAKTELTGPDGQPLPPAVAVFAVPMETQSTEAWAASALAQSVGEEAEAERILNGKPSA